MCIRDSCIRAYNNNEILIATDGAGVYKMNTDTYESIPYIVADYNRSNSMNGNTINDIYIDSEQRIWMANYPIGITAVSYTHLIDKKGNAKPPCQSAQCDGQVSGNGLEYQHSLTYKSRCV